MPIITLDFRILDVDGVDIVDPAVIVRLGATNSGHTTMKRFSANGPPIGTTMGAPAGSPLLVRVSTTRYRDSQKFGAVRDGLLTAGEPCVGPRRPDAWLAAFPRG